MEGYEKLDPNKWNAYRSAFIKSVRRGLVDDAVYWSAVLYQFGHVNAVWRRMLIHCSEDIGPAEPNLPANIRALYENYKDLVGWGQQDASRIPYTHAVILMAQARKSRIVDNAVICHYLKPLEDRPVPTYAFDHHGRVGRDMGRGVEYFFDESSKLSDQNPDCHRKFSRGPAEIPSDPYYAEARATAIAKQEQERKDSDE